MPRSSSRAALIPIAVLVAAIALAACGSNEGSTSSSATPPGSSASAGGATVALSDAAGLGEILVDADGRTLYLFEKDDEPDESYCEGDCAQQWPPLTVAGKPQAGEGLDAAKLTTFQREDGDTQVAYAGHPLYLYEGDQAPGDASGNGSDAFGAEWYALDAGGQPVEDEGGAEDSGGSSGYGY